MSKAIYSAIIFFASLSFLNSCTVPKALFVHTPDQVNAPGFKEKGEVKFDISLAPPIYIGPGACAGLNYSGSLAYAATNHLGIVASYNGGNTHLNNYTYSSYTNNYSGDTAGEQIFLHAHVFDIAAGYFNPISKRSKFEAYGGVGFGSIENISAYADPGGYSGKYYRLFLQADYGVGGRYFSFTCGAKLLYKKFDDFEVSPNAMIDSFPISQIRSKPFIFFQPFVEAQSGYKFIRFHVQAGIQMPLSQPSGAEVMSDIYSGGGYIYITSAVYIDFGITLQLAPRFFRNNSWTHQENANGFL
jgi:hypothetical protein